VATLFGNPRFTPVDAQGDPYPGATLTFYAAGTTTPQPVYTTSALTTPHPNPVTANAAGQFPAIYYDDALQYRAILRDATNVLLWDVDLINNQLTADEIGRGLYPRTTAEISANVTPTAYRFPPGDVRRYGPMGTGFADDTAAAQRWLNSGEKWLFLPAGVSVGISSALTLPTSGATIYGGGRIVAIASMAMAMLEINAKTGVTVDGIEVDGNGDLPGAHYGISVNDGSRNTIRNCYVHDTRQAGIRGYSESYLAIHNNRVIDCGRTGFTDNHGIMVYSITSTALQHCTITDNTVKNAFRKGIATYSASPGTVSDVVVSGNYVTGCDLGGIYVANAPATTDQRNIAIAGNVCHDNYVNILVANTQGFSICANSCRLSSVGNGIDVTDSQFGTVSGNSVDQSFASGVVVSAAVGTSRSVAVVGNTITRSNRGNVINVYGLQLNDSTECSAIGNVITDPDAYHRFCIIEDGTSSNNIIRDNILKDWQSAPASIIDSVTLANGANNNVAVGVFSGDVIAAGVTADFSITGIAGGCQGREVTIFNYTTYRMTVSHNSGSSAAGSRILCPGNAAVLLEQNGAVTFRYSIDAAAWYVVAVSQGIVGLPDAVTAPSTLAGVGTIYIDSADGDLKVKFGDGTVKTLATDT
jgi:parallel beta-helix repeat protein